MCYCLIADKRENITHRRNSLRKNKAEHVMKLKKHFHDVVAKNVELDSSEQLAACACEKKIFFLRLKRDHDQIWEEADLILESFNHQS